MRDSRYITYHYNNIIIRCCMEGEIVDIELITITRNVLLSAQMGERASVVLICIITSRYNEVK